MVCRASTPSSFSVIPKQLLTHSDSYCVCPGQHTRTLNEYKHEVTTTIVIYLIMNMNKWKLGNTHTPSTLYPWKQDIYL